MKCITKKLFLFVAFLASSFVFSQQVITGSVQDENGLPLPGVTVIETGTSNGVVTSMDGDYSITVDSQGTSLTFSYVGFKTQTIELNGRNRIDVTMEDDIESLSEVVITSLGFKESKDELGYASSTVKGDDVVESGESTLLNGLSGKSSGVRISRNSGDPGAGSYIQIRGLSSITRNSQPLIVVDGVPISNDVRGNSDRSGVSQESRLNDINPNDIESMSILKGASAAALWGTQALGGVIIITTKSGNFNRPLTVTYSSTYSYDEISQRYPLQTKYGQGDNGFYNQRARDSYGDLISDRSGGQDDFDTSGEFFQDQNGRIYYPILNKNSQEIYNDSNFDQIFDNGHFFENNLSLQGGNEKSTIFFSMSNLDQQGIIKNNSDYRRTTARFNAQHKFNEYLDLRISSTYVQTNSNRIRKGASSSGLYLGLLRNPADFNISGYRGDYYSSADASPIPNRHRSYREPLGADNTPTYNNPLWTINEQENEAKVDRFISNFELTGTPTKWLDLIARVGLDHYSEKRQEFFTPGSAAGAFRPGALDRSLATNTILNMDYIAKSKFEVSDFLGGSFLVGFNYNSKSRVVEGVEARNFIQFLDVDSSIRDVSNSLPENISVRSTEGHERTAGVYSALNLSAYDMLYVNGTLRVESASTFGDASDNTFAFPSLSVAWQFTELLNIEDSFLSFGKLRTSYGEVGIQPGRYNTSNTFVSPSLGDSFGGNLDISLFGNGGFVPAASRGNSSLKPERKKETELGLDLRFFENRFKVSATYFDNVTEDVLLDFPVPNSTGYRSIYANGAEIANKGVELDLSYQILLSENYSWSVNTNFTSLRNEVTNLAGIESFDLGGLSAVSSRAVEGFPLGVLWGSRILRDEQGSMVLDDFGFPVQDQVEGVIGDPNPDWQGAISSTFRYKNFGISALVETFQGGDIFAGTKSVLSDLGKWHTTANQVDATRNYLTSDGSVINIGENFRGNVADFGGGPVALTESWYNGRGGFFGGGIDELYVEDASWTRIRELRLSYLWDSPWFKSKTKLQSAEFSITGRNLIIWTDFEGNDPDTNLSGVSAARGIDYFNNPATKSYIFSLTLKL
ncbi:SusC/RagA family TonB-linked outer membrane protein [Psychroflexus sp. CAK57W]|uniref:SusC/RagA family TonB-linked outer membrane protein n=1 Tax=Psychroflexus curvus TaxID=2873595 RepID=UPI001CCA59AF|nr:SusC/RagA family TonB-linked outer membrane protein [Psychroflexus curvus]MBZ9787209.1 SusC/RagA family TonB-linked outer membrane protein [Psychroflexus curvus]